jgi:hypothetical protein
MTDVHRALAAGCSLPEALADARTRVDTSAPAGLVAATAFSCFGRS